MGIMQSLPREPVPWRFTVDDSVVLSGRGPLLVGHVEAGTIRDGDRFEEDGRADRQGTVRYVDLFRKVGDPAAVGIVTDVQLPAGVTLVQVRPTADAALRAHLGAFFAGHEIEHRTWPHGPILDRVPRFGVYAIGPGPRLGVWSYVTTGCWDAAHDGEHGLEFILSADRDHERHVELLAMLAYHHAGPPDQRLDLGHTTNIGEPWLPGSTLTHQLIALPYAFGPDLERCDFSDGHIRILTVQPITEAERDLKVAEGAEALEQRLEDAGIAWTDPFRPSSV
jgi:hypothetical protein